MVRCASKEMRSVPFWDRASRAAWQRLHNRGNARSGDDPMICPTCQGKPQQPPCMECGGTGFSHCCDGPPEQPAIRTNGICPDTKKTCTRSCYLSAPGYCHRIANPTRRPLIGHCACGSVLSAVTGDCVRGKHCPSVKGSYYDCGHWHDTFAEAQKCPSWINADENTRYYFRSRP